MTIIPKEQPPPPAYSTTQIIEDIPAHYGDDDSLVTAVIGPIGRWQIRRCVLLGLTFLMLAAHMMPYPLLAAKPRAFWCVESTGMGNGSSPHDPCTVHVDGVDTGRECTRWEFEPAAGGGVSLVEDFQLVCGREHLLSVRQVRTQQVYHIFYLFTCIR